MPPMPPMPRPELMVARPELVSQLKLRLLNFRPRASLVVIAGPPSTRPTPQGTIIGMGGVGKTTLAAMCVQEPDVRAAYTKIAWVSVGKEPNTVQLLRTLWLQLAKGPLPASVKDETAVLQLLRNATIDQSVLLVLDDVWTAAHLTLLNFLSEDGKSAVLMTTRTSSLFDSAPVVQCNTLATQASLELILKAGGQERLIPMPPNVVAEAVELCGGSPLALSIAGGIISQLRESWRDELLPLLKEESPDATTEERVVTASLCVTPYEMQEGVDGLFAVLAVFAAKAVVPFAAIELLAKLGNTQRSQPSQLQIQVWLQHLLFANILRGSVEEGLSLHDLVRDIMIGHAETSVDGGLRALQREAVQLLLGAFDAGAPTADYVSGSLYWHVCQARQPGTSVDNDALLMRVLNHGSEVIREQGMAGIKLSHRKPPAAYGAISKVIYRR